jgi:hypothetical protein
MNGGYRIAIKPSAIENNLPIKRLDKREDGELVLPSRVAADLEATHLSFVGEKELRVISATEQDPEGFDGYLVATGEESNGYGRSTRTATSGWDLKRKKTLERDGFECQICGKQGGPKGDRELHVDHIEPKFEGGTDELENLRILCASCHDQRHGAVRYDFTDSPDSVAKYIHEKRDRPFPAYSWHRLYNEIRDTFDVSATSVREVRDTLSIYDSWNTYDRGRRRSIFYCSPVTGDQIKQLSFYRGYLRYDGTIIEDGVPQPDHQYSNGSSNSSELLPARQTSIDEW